MIKNSVYLLIFIMLISCQDMTSKNSIVLTGSLELDKGTYEYNETITGTLTINEYNINELSVVLTLNGEEMEDIIDNSGVFQLTLTPEINTEYEITATVQYESEEVVLSENFIVKQIPFLGRWRAYSENSPAYPTEEYDIIGIWYIDGFELYYIDQNDEENLLTYSARGSMTFPTENEWITLTQEEYYNESYDLWTEWTYSSGIMYARYNFTDGVLQMEVELDLSEPADNAEYTWQFEKITDSIEPLY